MYKLVIYGKGPDREVRRNDFGQIERKTTHREIHLTCKYDKDGKYYHNSCCLERQYEGGSSYGPPRVAWMTPTEIDGNRATKQPPAPRWTVRERRGSPHFIPGPPSVFSALRDFFLYFHVFRPILLDSPDMPAGGDMDITSIGSSGIARDIADMGDLLKDITNAGMGLEKKLMTASVTEMVENSALGNGIDVSA